MNLPTHSPLPKITFWCRKAPKGNGYYLMCEINNDTQEVRFASGIKISQKSEWNEKTKTLKDINKEAIRQKIINDLNRIIAHLSLENKPLSPQTILNIYQKKAKAPTLLEVYQKYIKERKEVQKKKGELSKQTVRRYTYYYNALEKALNSLGLSKLLITEISASVVIKIEQELYKERNALSTQRHCNTLKNVIDYAYSLELIDKNPINKSSFQVKGRKPDIITYLTIEEINKLESTNFASQKLNQAKDFFLLMCYTGMSHIDLYNFNYSKDVITADNGAKVIWKKRQKTKAEFTVPLIPQAEEILKKYAYQVPKIRNDKLNFLLKEIAHIVGILTNLKSHVGRKTFGYIMLNVHKIPLEIVSKMYGHKNVNTTLKAYARHNTDAVIEATKHLINNKK